MQQKIELSFKKDFFSFESMCLGGFSILACFASWVFLEKSQNIHTVAQVALLLAFVINYPHFMSSYLLMYGDFRKNIRTKKRYFFSAIVVPFLLLSIITYSFINRNVLYMSYLINAMFFLVGWHYVKQVYGCIVVTSASRQTYFTQLERKFLLFNLFCLWALSWLNSQTNQAQYHFYGINHSSFSLPKNFLTAAYVALIISATLVIVSFIRKYYLHGKVIHPAGLMAYIALYVWYIPLLSHPAFAYFIPLFHSLQYMVFVWLFKSQKVQHTSIQLSDQEKRKAWLTKFASFLVGALILGVLSFELIPKFIDSQVSLRHAAFGSSPFLAATLIFINIHHYFIDNAIWRSDNKEVKKYLMAQEPHRALTSVESQAA